MEKYDVIVVGAGHAGCEAGLASARLGCRTLVLTLNIDNVALMPCNPSVGGPAKATLVREIDALGGQMGITTDQTYMQMRMLNTKKGPAVQALRAQVDRKLYSLQMKQVLETEENLFLQQGLVEEIDPRGQEFVVRTAEREEYLGKTIVVATGVYLASRIFMGDVTMDSGPGSQIASHRLPEALRSLGVELVRFKTGTPPRVNGRSIDYGKMQIHPGHEVSHGFSFLPVMAERDQVECWLTYTTAETHEIIKANLHRSAMYSGAICGVGPRYCPSIESKIVMFPDRAGHPVFVEPEGNDTTEVYLSGLSNSLPPVVQTEFLRTIPGLEQVEVMRYGYAIEYDCLASGQFGSTLELRSLPGVFTAGQFNGTSGYEEAACQGLMAGINAARKVKGEEPVILGRADGYIGVLIDDLVVKGTNEPYRMLTGLAEHRLLLRMDNADERLTPMGSEIGLASDARTDMLAEKMEQAQAEIARLKESSVHPSEEVNAFLAEKNSSSLSEPMSAYDLLKRPELSYGDIVHLAPRQEALQPRVAQAVEITVKYEGYIAKQRAQVERFHRMEEKMIPEELNYGVIPGLSREAVEKLSTVRPRSMGQAGRISGVSPGDLSVLLVYLETRGKRDGGRNGD